MGRIVQAGRERTLKRERLAPQQSWLAGILGNSENSENSNPEDPGGVAVDSSSASPRRVSRIHCRLAGALLTMMMSVVVMMLITVMIAC